MLIAASAILMLLSLLTVVLLKHSTAPFSNHITDRGFNLSHLTPSHGAHTSHAALHFASRRR
jgi:hypothetical protein